MKHLLLLGDEAIAQGALDAGLSGVYAYPGTPSTEITEYIQLSDLARERSVHSAWSANEKTAVEEALGMSFAGKRALVCMKHVGLNVAADGFMNAAMTGVNGGLIVLVADDPSMHSSQNEQDSRFYGKFAMIPIFEPSSQQEAYDMMFDAFDLSEKFETPVLMRITTRMAHSRSGVVRREVRAQNQLSFPVDERRFILLPANARGRYKRLLNLQSAFASASEQSAYNKVCTGFDTSLGIIACGIAYNYLMEVFGGEPSPYTVVKVSQYPAPVNAIAQLFDSCQKVLILEEGFPFLEEQLKGILPNGPAVLGRLDGTLPRDGELNPNLVAVALGKPLPRLLPIPSIMVNRPPALCKGCGHIDMYQALNEALATMGAGKVFGDIGCYTLGALPPFNSLHTCVDMGASVTMAKGAADAGVHPSVGVIGDSTFTHSGMTGLLDCVLEKTPVTLIIADNATAAMTGGQHSSAAGILENICLGLGVEREHIKVLRPLPKFLDENREMLANELNYKGVSVVIFQRECVQVAARRSRSK